MTIYDKDQVRGIEISFVFPDNEELKTVTVNGFSAPHKGEILSIHTDQEERKCDPGYQYKGRIRWIVDEVFHSVRVQGTPKDRLLYDNRYSVEVCVKRAPGWEDV
jgi:hypothetical protein